MTPKHHPSSLLREIMKMSKVKGQTRLVLLVMAEYSDWANVKMSQQEIGELSLLSERQVRRSIKNLVEEGYLTIQEEGNGRGRCTEYHINVTPYFVV